MKNLVKVFENEEFGSVRTLIIEGEVWFVGKDVASALGYTNSRDTLKKHVDEEDKGVTNCDTPGGKQSMTVINESGLYALIMNSKLPSAKKFKRWVTSEVLPSIRKTGKYVHKSFERNEKVIVKKTINGFPVMLSKDLSELLNVSVSSVYDYCRSLPISPRKLNRREIISLYEENGWGSVPYRAYSMYVFLVNDVLLAVRAFNKVELQGEVMRYFSGDVKQITVK